MEIQNSFGKFKTSFFFFKQFYGLFAVCIYSIPDAFQLIFHKNNNQKHSLAQFGPRLTIPIVSSNYLNQSQMEHNLETKFVF